MFRALLLFIAIGASLQAMEKANVQVQIGGGDRYGWRGPGWYYGYYFSNEKDYIAWREGRAVYYQGAYYEEDVWRGQGWYGGFWYATEPEWRANRYPRHRHARRHERRYERRGGNP